VFVSFNALVSLRLIDIQDVDNTVLAVLDAKDDVIDNEKY